jgi:hypothetical protein
VLHGYVIEFGAVRCHFICSGTLYRGMYRRQPHYGHVETVFTLGRQRLFGLGGFGELIEEALEGGIPDP